MTDVHPAQSWDDLRLINYAGTSGTHPGVVSATLGALSATAGALIATPRRPH
jgi:hypothetical protein